MVNERLKSDLQSLGIKKTDTLLMHSSLSSLGYVEGGADTVIDTLLSLLSEGTLLMPTLSYVSVTPEQSEFSSRETKSCVGCIGETFRKREGVIRSLHPTHSVAGTGRLARELLLKHKESDTPVGEFSPFALLPKVKGKILMLGCGLRPNTSMHGVEEKSVPPYLFAKESVAYTLIDEKGEKTEKTYRVHGFNGVIQRYDRLSELMVIPSGKVLSATAYLIDAEEMWETAHEKLLKDPLFFVDKA